MFAVIYSFEVKQDRKNDFENSWRELTRLIFKYEGSFGSRLHKESEHRYIAYAVWPDRETWANSGDKLPKEANEVRRMMIESCTEIKTIHELSMVDDLLDENRR